MFFKLFTTGLSFAAAASCAALEPRAACNADLCLRAFRASQIAGRLEQASSACNTAWVFTVTPSTTTIIETMTYSTTFTSVAQTTETNTASQTITATVYDISTVQGDPTSTRTIFTPAPLPGKKKRDLETSEGLPTWASVCSGLVRFTSACSCIGVTTAITVTAPTPSITITVISTTLSTLTTTLTATDSLTLTATETKTSITSTQTVHSVATARASQFKLQVRWTQTGMLRYVKVITSNGVNWLVPVDDFSTATIFSVDSSGVLFSVQDGSYRLVYAITPGSGTIGTPLRIGTSVPAGSTRLYCSIAESNNAVTCGIGSLDTFNRWSANSQNLNLYTSDSITYNTVTAVSP